MMVAFSGNRLTVTSLYGRRDPIEDDMDMMLTLVMIAELCTEVWCELTMVLKWAKMCGCRMNEV